MSVADVDAMSVAEYRTWVAYFRLKYEKEAEKANNNNNNNQNRKTPKRRR